ncbi:MAG: NHL repeat-containing protein [Desulfobacterales bacterium]
MKIAKAEICPKKEKGYVLVVVVFILLLLMVTVVALNRRAGLQAKIAANQVAAVQTQFGQLAAIENAAWQLLRNPQWRTAASGEDYEFDGVVYNRKILDSTRACPPDVIVVSITAPGGIQPVTAGLRIKYVHQETVYIADTENNKIKKVDPAGRLHTVPTPDLDKPRGVAVDAAGNIYIADTKNDRIISVDTSDTSEILAAGALDEPHGLCVQNGSTTRLYIADRKNNRIKTWEIMGHIPLVRIINAGSLRNPRGVAVDCPGNLYIADTDNDRVKQVNLTGEVSILNTGPLEHPWDLAADDRGSIYVADEKNNRIILVNTGGAVTTIGGSLSKPHGVAVAPSGNVYIADTDNHCVRRVDTDGVISTFAGKCGKSGDTGDGSLAIHSKLNKPHAVAVFSQTTSEVSGLEWITEFY